MKTITAQLSEHLQQELTSLATAWIVIRRDGTVYGFTDNDVDMLFMPQTFGDVPIVPLPFGGYGFTCLAASGFQRSNIADKAQLEVSSIQADGIIDESIITDHDIRVRLWDYAFVIICAVNWVRLAVPDRVGGRVRRPAAVHGTVRAGDAGGVQVVGGDEGARRPAQPRDGRHLPADVPR